MHCPNCDTSAERSTCRIIQTRSDTVESKLRQRECKVCSHKWWTCETDLPLGAVKWMLSDDDAGPSSFTVPRRVPGFLRITYS
jgi:transcriptional regulator NrdR family protein